MRMLLLKKRNILFFVLVLFSCRSYADDTDLSQIEHEEITNILGAWIVINPKSDFVLENSYNEKYSWGIGTIVPNYTLVIDYSETNPKLIIMRGFGHPEMIVEKISRMTDQKYMLHIKCPDSSEFDNFSEKKGEVYISVVSDRTIIIDMTHTWLIGPHSEELWYRLSGPIRLN